MINFISNLPSNMRTGGFSGMNVAAYSAIKNCGPVHYAGPINPPVNLRSKIFLKLFRAAGRPGNFVFYSVRRLDTIAQKFEVKCDPNACLNFFHGFTPWIHTRPTKPYVTWSDCTFSDYLSIYHRREDFSTQDIQRIEATEATWLQCATKVLFTSHWAARRAMQEYSLNPERVGVVGIFGEIEPPASDEYSGGSNFLFVSTDFQAKGGPVVSAAFQKLKRSYPRATLTVIGDSPAERTSYGGINFVGFLKKENPTDLKILREHLAQARALVHPTRSDISPLIIVEAGYFGCPVITTRRFAIPEVVVDGENGFLLSDPSDDNAVLAAMEKTLVEGSKYKQMRESAWIKSHGYLSKGKFSERLVRAVTAAIEQV